MDQARPQRVVVMTEPHPSWALMRFGKSSPLPTRVFS